MLRIKQTYITGLILAGLLVGCGGGGDSEANEATEQVQENNENSESNNEQNEQMEVEENGGNGASNQPTQTPPPSTSAKMFTAHVMPVLNAKCKSCHGSNGNFTITTANDTYANISDLKASVKEAGEYLLAKGSNTVGHGGGTIIATTSAEYATIKSWVDAGTDFN